MEDELCLAGYLVADGFAATDEDIAGSEHFFHFHSFARAGAVANLLLDGDIGRDGLCLVQDFLFLPILDSSILSTAFFSVLGVTMATNQYCLTLWGSIE